MFTAFSTALSALNAHSQAVDVVGNNLANLNTIGFKTSSVAFRDLVSQSLGASDGRAQVGLGIVQPLTARSFSQGAVKMTSGSLDVAIQGDGFLVLRDTAGGVLYTRGGNLQLDKNGYLVTLSGERVQGWMVPAGASLVEGPVGDIQLPVGALKPPAATRNFSFDLNLNASASSDPPETFTASLEVFDSLGAPHVVAITFTKSETANTWNYAVRIPDADVTAPVPPLEGTVRFDEFGALVEPAPDAAMPQFVVSGLKNGAADLELNWSLYRGLTPRLTQYAQPSALAANAQDGSAAAQLMRVGMGDGGVVLAQYSNGQQVEIARLAMASIRNPESLIAAGNNNYQLSSRSALPAIGLPGTGGRGTLLAGAVESSTVDIAREFANLIVYQRGYQANARVVGVADELSQETINLKR